jgi:hypothetical protein
MIGRLQKWAEAIGDPNEHPVVKFLRSALALLLNLTDPAHWENFKKAAGDAVDFVSEKIRVALGGRRFTKNDQGYLVPEGGEAPSTPEQGGVFGQGGLLDQLGLHRGGYESAVSRGLVKPIPAGTGGANFTPGAGGTATVTNNITINGSGLSAEQLQSTVEDALNASYSKALPAVSGGEK